MNRLYILEGADGTGKTTLSQELLAETKGHLLHASFNPEWDIPKYHEDLFKAAIILLEHQDVILDRWAVSEEVYAEAYRGGSSCSADEYMTRLIGNDIVNQDLVKLIYCTNNSIVDNHNKNKSIRDEMFDDILPVVREYERYMARTALDWIRYDFTKVDMKEFVRELIV